MRKPKLEQLLMTKLFPEKKSSNPVDWHHHVRRNLTQEVKWETLRFFGPNDCLESRYPGLDYNNPAHRMRLSQFSNHRKLFRAFDEFHLTHQEIERLCTWDGTKASRDAYEKINSTVRDTTWLGIEDFGDVSPTVRRFGGISEAARLGRGSSSVHANLGMQVDSSDTGLDEATEEVEEESEDEMEQSMGVELNERLLAATEARARGENASMDPDWEQWLKEAAERVGSHPQHPHLLGSTTTRTERSPTPVYWGREIPAYLHDTPAMVAIQAQLPPPPHFIPGSLSSQHAPL
ncbi:hypothetical protein MMC21_000844 [Puttea exsequens]|nr:hypothetical protein [Puttea exsequens]